MVPLVENMTFGLPENRISLIEAFSIAFLALDGFVIYRKKKWHKTNETDLLLFKVKYTFLSIYISFEN